MRKFFLFYTTVGGGKKYVIWRVTFRSEIQTTIQSKIDQSYLKEVQLIFGLEFQQWATFVIWLIGSNAHAEIQTFNRHYFKKLWKIAIVAMICIPSLLWWIHADSRSVSCTDDLIYVWVNSEYIMRFTEQISSTYYWKSTAFEGVLSEPIQTL